MLLKSADESEGERQTTNLVWLVGISLAEGHQPNEERNVDARFL